MNSDEERWNVVVKTTRRPGISVWDETNWVRAPGNYPDFPSQSVRRRSGWDRTLKKYMAHWYRFLCGLEDEPPLPTQAVGANHLAVAQREWRKRNGYPEPKMPVQEDK